MGGENGKLTLIPLLRAIAAVIFSVIPDAVVTVPGVDDVGGGISRYVYSFRE